MNQEQTNITTGKQIRHLRTQLGMTQEELAGELNVTRQALSNWERDVNEPDLNMLKKICFLFGVNMDDFAKEVITKMETYHFVEVVDVNQKQKVISYDDLLGILKTSWKELENMDIPELPKEGREMQEESNRGLKGTTIGEILAARGILLEPDQAK